MRILLLASCVLVTLAVAEAIPQFSDFDDIFSNIGEEIADASRFFLESKKEKKTHPIQAENSCDSSCGCTNLGGLCIPIHQNCTNPFPGGGDCKPKPSNKSCKCCLQPTVYKQDIENTVAYFLKYLAVNNITTGLKHTPKIDRILDQTVQKALSNIIETFAQHLPLKPSLKSFLNCLSGILPTSDAFITGQNLTHFYQVCKIDRLELPEVLEWVGCRNIERKKGELPGWQSFRSYPCGVWITFHTLTVKLASESHLHQALPTLRHFVKYFPWCSTCQKDFLSMYNDPVGGGEGLIGDAAVMWLWKGHNRVTARTATKFVPEPKNYVWLNSQCRLLWHIHGVETLENCMFRCKEDQRCTAINYNIESLSSKQCRLRACELPAPTPLTQRSGWQGYTITTGCDKGTDKGRSHWQFPGVNQCRDCQSSKPPWTGCGFPQIHQNDLCFNEAKVLPYLKTMYSTFY